ncbi:MAG: hypothetical protein V4635_12170 [Bacteroidota bacterium]
MKKKILLATSTLALTAGSIFALSGAEEQQTMPRTATEQCLPECCNGNGGDCGTIDCQKSGADCCEEK